MTSGRRKPETKNTVEAVARDWDGVLQVVPDPNAKSARMIATASSGLPGRRALGFSVAREVVQPRLAAGRVVDLCV